MFNIALAEKLIEQITEYTDDNINWSFIHSSIQRNRIRGNQTQVRK